MKKRLIFGLLLTLSLQGCIFVVGAAAGAAAIAVVHDHRSVERAIQDTKLSNKIIYTIRGVPELKDDSHIEVTAFNGVILLTGETPKPEWRQRAEQITRAIAPDNRVYNQINIQGPTSSLTRTSDAWISTKVKSLMIANDDLKSSSIKVLTEDGVVYLMGQVTPQQADIAVDIARQVSGVQKVVKIFSKNS